MSTIATVSAIIPAYNAARTLGETLESLRLQTRAPDEIILVDDGSYDVTGWIARSYQALLPNLRVLTQVNAGPMEARNAAIAHASGSLIAPLDADDLWHPRYLERMTDALAREPEAGFAYALHRLVDEHSIVMRDGPDFGIAGRSFHRHLLVNFVGNGSSAVFRREALLAAGAYDVRAYEWGGAEDYLLQLRIAARASVIRVGERLVGYRRGHRSFSWDAARAHRSRLAALAHIASEHPKLPPLVERWVRADAARVRAAASAGTHQLPSALYWASSAFVADPNGTLADVLQRLANANVRSQSKERGSSAMGMPFSRCDPYDGTPTITDPITQQRLAQLARLDEACPSRSLHS